MVAQWTVEGAVVIESVLDIKNLHFAYGENKVLKDVSLQLQKGAIHGLLGASGCGKTTLLRIICELEEAQEGSITPAKRNCGLVFQDYALFPHLTVKGNLMFGLKYISEDKRREQLEKYGKLLKIGKLMDRYPHELSGGQQQRVALARSLVVEPDILLLDEPFSHLDEALKEDLLLELKELFYALGTTVLFATHNQEEALQLSDNLTVMLDGEIHQWGDPEEVYSQPVSSQVAEFLGRGSFLPAECKGSVVRCELGSVKLSRPLQDGRGQLFLRPENVKVDSELADQGLEIVGRHYFGSHYLLHLKLPSGADIYARSNSQSSLAIGQKVGVTIINASNFFPH